MKSALQSLVTLSLCSLIGCSNPPSVDQEEVTTGIVEEVVQTPPAPTDTCNMKGEELSYAVLPTLSTEIEEIRFVPFTNEHELPEVTDTDARHLIRAQDVAGTDFKFRVYDSHYEHYKQHTRIDGYYHNIVNYLTPYDPTIVKIAHNLRKRSSTDQLFAQHVLDFVYEVHSYDISFDNAHGGEYKKFPLETLIQEEGDCDDAVILAGSIMMSGGLDVAIIHYLADENDGFIGHFGLLVKGDFSGWVNDPVKYDISGDVFYYADPTSTIWQGKRPAGRIGERSVRHENRRTRVYLPRLQTDPINSAYGVLEGF